jgi:hypothetical protein
MLCRENAESYNVKTLTTVLEKVNREFRKQ